MAEASAAAYSKNPAEKPAHNPRNREIAPTYAQAAKANPETQAIAEDVARRFGGKAEHREGLKGQLRAQQKIGTYKGDASQLLDISGSRVVFDNLSDVYNALKYVRNKYKVVYFKDRFVEPTNSGFRDLLLNIRAKNGHIIEIRISTKQIEKISALEHRVYERWRTIKDKIKTENRKPTEQEIAILQKCEDELEVYRGQYQAAWLELVNKARGEK
jgi:ppGpp synthetase/RelA/SpoT-type nucleotidyltranferase